MFFIEVMGRNSGSIALEVGITGGAEAILIPEVPTDLDRLASSLADGRSRGKTSFIIIVAEGAVPGGAAAVGRAVKEQLGVDYRVSILGHVQRGGSPTSFDRALATRMGRAAVEALLAGETGKMVGIACGEMRLAPLEDVSRNKRPVDLDLLDLVEITSK